MSKSGSRLIAVAFASLLVASCSDTGIGLPEIDGDDLILIEVTAASEAIFVGETTQVTAAVINGRGDDVAETVEIFWSSSDDTIVSVDSQGLATGVSLGLAIITATTHGLEGSIEIEVEAPS